MPGGASVGAVDDAGVVGDASVGVPAVGRPAPGARVSVEGGLAAISGALGRLREVEWWRLSEGSVMEAASAVEATLRSGFGVQIRLAAEIAERSMYAAGERSAAHLLARVLRIPVGQAKGHLAAAAAALGVETPTGELIPPTVPELATAIDAGAISDEHVRVITTAAAAVPPAVDADTRALCHEVLLHEATVRDPLQLRRVADQIEVICTSDGSEPAGDAVDRIQLIIGARRRDGLIPTRGLMDDVTAEGLRVALEDLAARRPVDDDTPDRRPAPVRLAQASSEVIARYLAVRNRLPEGLADGGVRPVIAVTIPAADLAGSVHVGPRGDGARFAEVRTNSGAGRFDYGGRYQPPSRGCWPVTGGWSGR